MRLLHLRHDHDRRCPGEYESQPLRSRNLSIYGRQHLPLRNAPQDRGRDPKSGQGDLGVRPMSTRAHLPDDIEPERYELTAPPTYHFQVDRRDFFKFLGGGILIVSALKNADAAQESGAARRQSAESLSREISAWLHIGENGSVTVYTGKVELGQNIRTSLSQ